MKTWGFLVLLISCQRFAVLGEKSSSVQSIKAQFKATDYKETSNSTYSVHEMNINGNVVKEFVNANGDVFAVTWQGIKPPDLSQLFGSYYTEYEQARGQQKLSQPQGKRQLTTKSKNLVVQRSGHMRDLRGKACLPELAPTTLTCESLPQ